MVTFCEPDKTLRKPPVFAYLTRAHAREYMNWLVIAAHLLSKVNIQEEMAKPEKTTTQPQALAYLTRARARAGFC